MIIAYFVYFIATSSEERIISMSYDLLNNFEPKLVSIFKCRIENDSNGIKSYGERITDYYELDFITDSKDGIIIQEGREIHLCPGMLFFRKPGMKVEGISTYSCFYVQLTIENFEKIPFPDIILIKNFNEFENLLKHLYYTYVNKPSLYNFMIKTTLYDIFYFMYNESIEQEDSCNSDKRLQNVINYINENYSKNITLDDIALACGYSKYRLCHIMKKKYGTSPIIYLTKCRINQACLLLIETDKSIKEIMYEVGFNNQVSFFRLFKNHTNYTPTEYRRLHKLNFI